MAQMVMDATVRSLSAKPRRVGHQILDRLVDQGLVSRSGGRAESGVALAKDLSELSECWLRKVVTD
jgi:hypothetical protein